MKLYSLEKLNTELTNELKDLTETKFRKPQGTVILLKYVVPKKYEMRMDLVSNELYDTPEYMDLLLFVNDIVNPFSLLEGSTLLYPSQNDIVKYQYVSNDPEQVQKTFLNNSKTKRNDRSREKYLNENVKPSLPPTVTDRATEQVQIEGDTIIIGKGLFNT